MHIQIGPARKLFGYTSSFGWGNGVEKGLEALVNETLSYKALQHLKGKYYQNEIQSIYLHWDKISANIFFLQNVYAAHFCWPFSVWDCSVMKLILPLYQSLVPHNSVRITMHSLVGVIHSKMVEKAFVFKL